MNKFFKHKTIIFLGIIFAVLLLPKVSQAATINVVNCSQSAVQAAINSASDGDTVLVPAGSCTWTTPVIFYKAITVQGAGIDQTIITDNTASGWANTPFWIEGSTGKNLIRITGFTFNDVNTPESFGAITIVGSNNTFRIDHIKFDGLVSRSIWIQEKTYGVIDHNTFNYTDYQGVIIVKNEETTSWATAMSWGTADAVYIEDNTFTYNPSCSEGVTDSEDGGRIVFRYNTVIGGMIGNHGYDSVPRSGMQVEIYENTFTNNGASVFPAAIQFRGGTGYVYNNTITGNYFNNNAIAVTNYRSVSDGYFFDKGWCNGTVTSPIADGNTDPTATYRGWPCVDQIGRGTNQGLYPLYEYNNTINGGDGDIAIYQEGSGTSYLTTHIQSGRDYYNDTQMPNYTPYTYPHPLTLAGVNPPPDTTPPAAPSGVTVN